MGVADLIIAGPCSVDNPEYMDAIAAAVSKLGLRYLRGGAFKPRTSPHSFSGIGKDGIFILRDAAKRHGLRSVSEITDCRDIDLFSKNIDVIQIGARNMQNGVLLREVGRTGKTVLLKRGFMNTVDELMYSVEYLTVEGNSDIIICERGVRTFQQHSRFSLDITSVMEIQERTGFPVIVDPSHATGRSDRVVRAALSGIAAGADGLLIETHIYPAKSLSDAGQTINLEQLAVLVDKALAMEKIL